MDRPKNNEKKETIQQMKARMRHSKKHSDTAIKDPFEKADKVFATTRKRTGLAYDDAMVLHKCPWDENYPECPLRYTAIMNRFLELDLVNRCQIIPSRSISDELVQGVHDSNMFEALKRISGLPQKEMEDEASKFDAIYFNEKTFEAACIAAGSVLNAIRSVCEGEIHNAFALVRPPGHHAMAKEYCGYCYFNNVAIGVKEALNKGWAKKVLIVDFDVHHGQATQQMFYRDNRVLYFSFHRYEHGLFWPNLRESNFDFIGEGAGKGYNINVPLNDTGLEDNDYFAVIFNILLPVAYEFSPDLVIFSAGYDACIGCPEGEMKLSPGFYGQFITLLAGLAHGRQVVCLEGGYFIDSLAEGAAMSLKSLLNDPPAMIKPFGEPAQCITDVINNLRFMLIPFWKSLQLLAPVVEIGENVHTVTIKYLGVPLIAPFETRDCYPVQNEELQKQFREIVEKYKEEYAMPIGKQICYVFDEIMYEHKTPENFPENPERLMKIYEKFTELKLYEHCNKIPSRMATKEELLLLHDEQYIDSLFDHTYMPNTRDVHYTDNSLAAILTAAGCLLNVVDNVMQDKHQGGVAMIRPPGHHAEPNEAMGFCLISNVALAAKYALKEYKTKKILIVDFDVHHGNGTQKAFYNSNEVLYISIHQYNQGHFFPTGEAGNFDKVGDAEGIGFNVNIPFNKDYTTDFMGDAEYINVFHHIVLPIAYSFGPELVLISAGFDAGLNDPIGNYRVTPEAFGHFVHLLKPLARGKIILALEGGYNVNTVAYSMTMCIKAMLGDALPKLQIGKMHKSALKTIETVINMQKQYWPILRVKKILPDKIDSLMLLKNAVPIVICNPDIERIQKLTIEDYNTAHRTDSDGE